MERKIQMKKLIAVLAASMLIFNHPIITNASEITPINTSSNESSEIVDLGDGYTVKYETKIVSPNVRASTKTVAKTATCVYGGKTVAEITLTASFSYTGSSATCTSASISSTTYDGWTCSDKSASRSGNTATGTGKLKKGLLHTTVNVSLTCSKTGAIS